MLQKTFIIFFLFGFVSNTLAQDIRKITKTFYADVSKRLACAEKLRTYYLDVTADSLFPIATFLIDEGVKKHEKSWLYYGKYLICYYYNSKNKINYSYANLLSCKQYYEAIRDKESLAKVLDLLGQSSFLDLRYAEAIDYYVESMQMHRESSSDYVLSNAQLNLCEAFYAMGRYDSAEKEIESFIRQARQENLSDAIRKGYNLSGKIYLVTNRKEQAYQIWEKAMKLAKQFKNPKILASNYNLMAIALAEQGQLEEAKSYFEKSLELRIQTNNPPQICESAYNLGELSFLSGDFMASIGYYQQALDWANKYKLLSEKADALEAIGYAWAELKQHDKAFEYAMLYAEKQDSLLLHLRTADQMLDEDFQNQESLTQSFVQRQRERILEERIRNERRTSYLLFGSSIVLIVILFYIIMKKSKTLPTVRTLR